MRFPLTRFRWSPGVPVLAAVLSLACLPAPPVSDGETVGESAAAETTTVEAPEIEIDLGSTISAGGELLIGPGPGNGPTGFPTPSAEEVPDSFAAPVAVTGGVLDALWELSGFYEVSVTRLEDGCTFGPDVPFDDTRGIWLGPPGESIFPYSQKYYTHLVQRGDAVGFELGEGIVFARPAEGFLTDVERIGADGVTFYQDAFTIGSDGEGRRLISGESNWVFHDDYQAAGEVCAGRTSWKMVRQRDAPAGDSRDLHFSLRWSAESEEDLDLVIGRPFNNMATASADHSKSYLGEVDGNCFVVRSAGYAVAGEGTLEPSGFVSELRATTGPYHEEIISCSWAPYGQWTVDVVNWNPNSEVYYEIGAYRGAAGESAIGYTTGTVPSLQLDSKIFNYAPQPADSAAGVILTSTISRQPAQRLVDSVSKTFLGFNKAAYEGVPYEAFLASLGL